jgi:hypothetical protein
MAVEQRAHVVLEVQTRERGELVGELVLDRIRNGPSVAALL